MVNPSAYSSPSDQKSTAIIVGGGPTGSLTALYLAQMGWHVSVYERRSVIAETSSTRRSFNIVLNRRALNGLEEVGVQLSPEKVVSIQGGIRHTVKQAKLSQGFRDSISIDRFTLAQSLISDGKNRYPDKINYYFNQKLLQINIQEKTAVFQAESKQHEETFDLLVGAGGVFSTVRAAMESQIEEFTVRQNTDNMLYKICDLGLVENFSGATKEWENRFHTWPGTQPVTLLAPPKIDGTLNGVLILPQEGEITFDKLQTEEDICTLFKEKFPNIFPNLDQAGLPSHFAQDLLSQKAANGGITTVCNQLVGSDCIVLLGDAAHSVWPSLGQGCNTALESCRVFANTLAQSNGNLSVALPTFSQIRKPDVDAIAQLSEIGFGGNKRATSTLFIAKVLILMLLHKLLPKWFHKYALLQLGDANVPYSKIWQQSQKQEKQLLVLLAVVIAIGPVIWLALQIS
ncbi:NAD(P)/FAD-dependent oxidoreductase [Acaryochloris sp. IP29b_bin.148]|uniref:FAD-dependent oxidoreductase n=1 Tax=Acaryochloris sp. IP29b_bin.148 TaxID=2969218 RepID=UPI0026361D72|nr:NAD(P)/FAD-dependent oxidoreductase [Acaryochloris sp. IP29b_bin.148]